MRVSFTSRRPHSPYLTRTPNRGTRTRTRTLTRNEHAPYIRPPGSGRYLPRYRSPSPTGRARASGRLDLATWAVHHPLPKTMLLGLRPAGSPEPSSSARSCVRLPAELRPAPASPGQSAAWAVLAGVWGLFRHRWDHPHRQQHREMRRPMAGHLPRRTARSAVWATT